MGDKKGKKDKKEDTENQFKRRRKDHIYVKTTIYSTYIYFLLCM